MPSSPPAVQLSAVTHRYGAHTALRDVSMTIEPGAMVGLLGPNGSGKTTLFRILTTLMPPSEGTARIFGHDVTTEPAAVRQRIGTVFQDPALDEALTVRENLRFQGAFYGLYGTALHTRIDAVLARLGVAGRADDKVETLSGGLQRRADLARGLLHRPDLLLLDEPTTGLDPAARRAFWTALDALRADEGTTLLITTHLMDEAEPCDAVTILDEGGVVAQGPPAALKAELGDETLWIETPAPEALRDRIEAQFGVTPRIVSGALQISHPNSPKLLAALYEALGDHIASATVRAPTLDDVFMVRTGHRADAGLRIAD